MKRHGIDTSCEKSIRTVTSALMFIQRDLTSPAIKIRFSFLRKLTQYHLLQIISKSIEIKFNSELLQRWRQTELMDEQFFIRRTPGKLKLLRFRAVVALNCYYCCSDLFVGDFADLNLSFRLLAHIPLLCTLLIFRFVTLVLHICSFFILNLLEMFFVTFFSHLVLPLCAYRDDMIVMCDRVERAHVALGLALQTIAFRFASASAMFTVLHVNSIVAM